MLLAWDSTDRLNWGARAAHLATHQILSGADDQIERLSGDYQTQARPINLVLPEWLSCHLRVRRHRAWWARAYMKAEHLLDGQEDYIHPRPEVSVRNILNNLDDEHIRGLYEAVRRHDTIVVDGDGDMIFKADPRRNLLADLALIELGRHFDKEVYYVNSIFADCPVTGRNEALAARCLRTLEKCDGVAFRDPQSLELYRELGGREDAQCIPDTLFHWYDDLKDSRRHLPEDGDFVIPYGWEDRRHFGRLDFSSPYVCVTGGSRAAFTPEDASEGFCRLVSRLHELEHPVYLVPTCGGDRFLHEVAEETGTPIIPGEVPILMGGAILANARLFVTGRYHPSIMAASGGTPCVFLGADSHKTLSIQRMLGYEEPHAFSAIPPPEEHSGILAECRERLDGGQTVRDRIQRNAEARAEETVELATLVNGDAPSR